MTRPASVDELGEPGAAFLDRAVAEIPFLRRHGWPG
jgi:hypothetical protein